MLCHHHPLRCGRLDCHCPGLRGPSSIPQRGSLQKASGPATGGHYHNAGSPVTGPGGVSPLLLAKTTPPHYPNPVAHPYLPHLSSNKGTRGNGQRAGVRGRPARRPGPHPQHRAPGEPGAAQEEARQR